VGVKVIKGAVEEALSEDKDKAVEKTVAVKDVNVEVRLDVDKNTKMEAMDPACEYAKSSLLSLQRSGKMITVV
jgi:hypothetical protein